MPRHAILHIGPMKTGSSSIQFWLTRRAGALAEQGLFVPTGMGPNMSRLAAIAEAKSLGLEATETDLAKLDAFQKELDALDPSTHTIIISGEMLGHQLNQPEQLRFLVDLLSPYVDRYSVIVYLRRQDELSLSRYTTALRRGERRARPLSSIINYKQMMDLWSGVFGNDSVIPRIYERDLMPNGDVVQDFAQVAGLPYEDTEKAIDQNPSLRPEAQAFLADLAARVREAGYERPFETVTAHNIINKYLSGEYRGRGAMPSRAEATAFMEKAAAPNEHVRAKWFPDRESLFSRDFSQYPENGSDPVPPETLTDVAMNVLVRLVTSNAGLEPNPRAKTNIARRDLDEKLRKERRTARGARRKGVKRQA